MPSSQVPIHQIVPLRIYAAHVAPGGAFTHTSYNDYEIAADNLSNSDHRRVSDRIQAYALYIDPPLGRVLVAKYPMALVNRAYEKGKT